MLLVATADAYSHQPQTRTLQRPQSRRLQRPAHLVPRARQTILQEPGVDTKLLAADTTLIFAYSFARTLCNVLLAPDFPGWLAPIQADPIRLSNTFNFASSWAIAWISAALLTGAFGTGINDMQRVGLRGAAITVSIAAAIWFSAAFIQDALVGNEGALLIPALSCSLETGQAALGIAASLLVWRTTLVGG